MNFTLKTTRQLESTRQPLTERSKEKKRSHIQSQYELEWRVDLTTAAGDAIIDAIIDAILDAIIFVFDSSIFDCSRVAESETLRIR